MTSAEANSVFHLTDDDEKKPLKRKFKEENNADEPANQPKPKVLKHLKWSLDSKIGLVFQPGDLGK